MIPLLWTSKEGPSDGDDIAWPCLKGGSVAVTAATTDSTVMNCMIFYNAPMQSLVSSKEHSKRTTACQGLVRQCESIFDRFTRVYAPPIDLTSLAACIFESYPGSLEWKFRKHLAKLRGVAAFPSYHEPRDDSSGYGLYSENGRFYQMCTTEIPVVNLEERDPTLAICYALLFSESQM